MRGTERQGCVGVGGYPATMDHSIGRRALSCMRLR